MRKFDSTCARVLPKHIALALAPLSRRWHCAAWHEDGYVSAGRGPFHLAIVEVDEGWAMFAEPGAKIGPGKDEDLREVVEYVLAGGGRFIFESRRECKDAAKRVEGFVMRSCDLLYYPAELVRA